MGIMITYHGYNNLMYNVHKMWGHIIHSEIRYLSIYLSIYLSLSLSVYHHPWLEGYEKITGELPTLAKVPIHWILNTLSGNARIHGIHGSMDFEVKGKGKANAILISVIIYKDTVFRSCQWDIHCVTFQLKGTYNSSATHRATNWISEVDEKRFN